MKIGTLELGEKPLFLAPMESVTDPSFRFICKEYGADVLCTEFVSSDGLIRGAKSTKEKLLIEPYEYPIAIQIYGHIKEAMVEAAQIAAHSSPSYLDINFGCPVRKIAGRGAGSGMMRNPDKLIEITEAVVKAVSLPVTVKTRLGWDMESKIIVDLALRLQDVGVAALTIHGRTGTQLYRGEADWTLIGEIKESSKITIPIVGNGDIKDAAGAKEAFDRYGVDGVMIGRATYGRPWLFKQIKRLIETGEELPDPTTLERVELAKKHLLKSVEVKGERVGVLEMRRHLSAYFKGYPNFK
ncbi:MAG: tRNA dihydrouridine synthase DusB, partial [Bacteroidales bacterium]